MSGFQKQEVWPVMLTPFTKKGNVDYKALDSLIVWYEENEVDGLFAVCQSSEMFYLSLRERVKLAGYVKNRAKMPVISSGHISDSIEEQLEELKRLSETGVDAVIMVTNRIAQEGSEQSEWKENLLYLLDKLDPEIPLGLYECPYPYKHLLHEDELKLCADSGRFKFMKDTCCDIDLIRRRQKLLKGSSMNLYNANTATLLDSLKAGIKGYSGVMANFHPELYVWLLRNWEKEPEKAKLVQSALTMCSQIEKQLYPVNAKYHLQNMGFPLEIYTRSKNHRELQSLFKDEVKQMAVLVKWVKDILEIY